MEPIAGGCNMDQALPLKFGQKAGWVRGFRGRALHKNTKGLRGIGGFGGHTGEACCSQDLQRRINRLLGGHIHNLHICLNFVYP